MNLIKALNGLSAEANGGENSAPAVQPARTVPEEQTVNVMASVLERHEQISNRVKNKK